MLIVVLCHNQAELTLSCLASLQRLSYGQVTVLVIDNASADDTVAQVKRHFPGVLVNETGQNLGYAAGNNVGLRLGLARGFDYVLLLNNDTEVAPDFLEPLVRTCEADPGIGMVGPKIFYHDEPDTLWSAGGVIDWRRGLTYMRGIDQVDSGQFDREETVDFVTGCALLVRCRALAACGFMDERFGMYFEETEWCVRVARAGWRIVYVPDSQIWHKIRPREQDWSPRVTYYMTRNRLLFLRLTGASLGTWLHAALFQDLRTWCSWRLRRRWRGRNRQRRALRRGWQDFVLHRFGMVPWPNSG